MSNSRLLAVVAVLQGLILASIWTGSGPLAPANAQIPDAGGQRADIVNELKSLNAKADKLIEILKSGDIQVKLPADEKKKE